MTCAPTTILAQYATEAGLKLQAASSKILILMQPNGTLQVWQWNDIHAVFCLSQSVAA